MSDMASWVAKFGGPKIDSALADVAGAEERLASAALKVAMLETRGPRNERGHFIKRAEFAKSVASAVKRRDFAARELERRRMVLKNVESAIRADSTSLGLAAISVAREGGKPSVRTCAACGAHGALRRIKRRRGIYCLACAKQVEKQRRVRDLDPTDDWLAHRRFHAKRRGARRAASRRVKRLEYLGGFGLREADLSAERVGSLSGERLRATRRFFPATKAQARAFKAESKRADKARKAAARTTAKEAAKASKKGKKKEERAARAAHRK